MAKNSRETRFLHRRNGPTDGRTDGPTDGPTDRRTDGRTDKPSYRDARTHLKRGFLDNVVRFQCLFLSRFVLPCSWPKFLRYVSLGQNCFHSHLSHCKFVEVHVCCLRKCFVRVHALYTVAGRGLYNLYKL